MRVGVLPASLKAEARHSYSPACRAYALIDNLDFCELYAEGKEYDIVYLQKRFDATLVQKVKATGATCVLDTCDSYVIGPERAQRAFKNALLASDVISVPTEMLQKKMKTEFPSKEVLVGFDVMEFEPNHDLADKEEPTTVVVYGSYHNVAFAANVLDQLASFERVVFVTDNDHHLDQLKKVIGTRQGFEFRGWVWTDLQDLLQKSHASLVVYKTPMDGLFKSCNRSLISLHYGTPVVSGRNPHIAELNKQLGGWATEFVTISEIEYRLQQAVELSRKSTREERGRVRGTAMMCEFGCDAALNTWEVLFDKVNEMRKGV